MPLSSMYAGENKSPFSNALSNFMQARQTAQTQRLFAPAMSGDLSALNQLMSVNPQAGMQVQQVMSQQQQQAAQAQQQQVQNRMEAMKAGIQYDPETGEMTMQPKGMGFEGSGLTGQMMNLIAEGERNPAVKQTPEYKLAVAQLSRAEMIPTEQGMITRPGIDIAQALGGARQAPATGTGGVVTGTEKTAPLQKEYTDKWIARERMNGATNRYKEILDELGPQISAGPLNAKDQVRLATAYTKLQLEAKTAAELGALSGPDLGLVEKWIPDPTSLSGAVKGKEALLGSLDEYMGALESDQAAFESGYEGLNIKKKPLTKLKKGQAKSVHPEDITSILEKYK